MEILGVPFSGQRTALRQAQGKRLADRERKAEKDCVNVENGVKLGFGDGPQITTFWGKLGPI